MNDTDVSEAFSAPDHIVSFSMGGSELLLYRNWRWLVDTLFSAGVRLNLSTNGMLLDRDAIDFLFARPYLDSLNISLDGATRETIEAIRVKVRYNQLLANIDYLFSILCRAQVKLSLSFSFLLMRRNYKELPKLFPLLDSLRAEREVPIHVTIQSLVNAPNDSYQSFVRQEGLGGLEESELRRVFSQAAVAAQRHAIGARVFNAWDLSEFTARDVPFPMLPGLGSRRNLVHNPH
ncbi:MAG: radical SAM protein [Acidobacteriota bacterium]